MTVKRAVKILILILFACLAASIGLFIYNANKDYNINAGFSSIPLQYNAENNSSTYNWNGTAITVYGGFVKGIQKEGKNEHLIIRALFPLPTIEIKSSSQKAISINLENINPDFYSKQIDKSWIPNRISVNTLQFNININANEEKKMVPNTPDNTDSDNYIILGDNRDGYDTFDQIINQVNSSNPVFVIDNGDLVFSGKANQYRLFDQAVSKISTTLCTELGNHDIRRDGRNTYTKLYGPAYYSFDFGNNHFAFVDSSRGWAEKTSIPDEGYTWLEQDLQKVQGKNIYVITHIPPVDPRSNTTPNAIPAYVDQMKNNSSIETILDNYRENENMNHGFQDPTEAARFEKIMTKYNVNTVYLSHIHSYFDFTKDNVRYVISGGAGAELLTKNSYYHYVTAKLDDSNTLTITELPSPANNLITRYGATAKLLGKAMYIENKTAVVLFIIGIIVLLLLIVLHFILKFKNGLSNLGILLKDTGKYIAKRFKEIYRNKK